MTEDTIIDLDDDAIHILFVEDEPDLNVLINLALEYMDGIEAHVVMTAEKAIDFLKKQKIHAIVSDHYLPKMLGIELLTHVKTNYPKIRRFLITGSIEGAVFDWARRDAEPIEIFEKPLIIEDIINKVVKSIS